MEAESIDGLVDKQPDWFSDLDSTLTKLVDGDFQARWEASQSIQAWGTAAIAPLIDLLDTDDPELAWFVARILGQLHHPDAVATLVGLLHADDPELTSAAADALANQGEMAIALLIPQLDSIQTRQLAVRSLGLIQHPARVEPLLRMVQDQDAEVRRMAIAALSSVADDQFTPTIAPALVTALQDPATTVRQEAIIGVGLLASRLRHGEGSGVVYSLDDLAIILHPHIWEIDLAACSQAILALGRVGSDRACVSIQHVLLAPTTPPPLQQTCLLALGGVQTPTALHCLHQALLQFIPQSPDQAQIAINTIGQTDATELVALASHYLLDLLAQATDLANAGSAEGLASPAIRQCLALNLGRLGTKYASPLIAQALQQVAADSDTGVRLHGIAALKSIQQRIP